MWLLAGSQAIDQPILGFGPGPEAGGSATLGLCVRQLASAPGAHPPEVLGVGAPGGLSCGRPAGVSIVGPRSADLGASNWASGEHRGCLSRIHRPGAEGGGAPEAAAAAESSLISC